MALVGKSKMTAEICVVPGCMNDAEMTSPREWCSLHWEQWWFWPEELEEPDWMPVK